MKKVDTNQKRYDRIAAFVSIFLYFIIFAVFALGETYVVCVCVCVCVCVRTRVQCVCAHACTVCVCVCLTSNHSILTMFVSYCMVKLEKKCTCLAKISPT